MTLQAMNARYACEKRKVFLTLQKTALEAYKIWQDAEKHGIAKIAHENKTKRY